MATTTFTGIVWEHVPADQNGGGPEDLLIVSLCNWDDIHIPIPKGRLEDFPIDSHVKITVEVCTDMEGGRCQRG